MKEAEQGGAPRKSQGGLTKVLYVRADAELAAGLDVIRGKLSRGAISRPSMADVVRHLLWEAINRSKETDE